ncbi:MAG: hypothetical protein GX230_03690 [Lentisphaerae bacterium]|jgi:hypothetical protein|nr:hypothetical protein [Lentisphaerota bacterium]
MIPDLQASLLCDDVRQERNGKFILIGIFEGLIVSQLPSTFHRICLVNRWCCGDGTFMQRSRIVAPDGKTVVCEGQQVPIKLAGQEQNATSVEVFMNMRVQTEGTHWVEVLLDQQMRMRYPLHVRKVDPQKQQKPAPQE